VVREHGKTYLSTLSSEDTVVVGSTIELFREWVELRARLLLVRGWNGGEDTGQRLEMELEKGRFLDLTDDVVEREVVQREEGRGVSEVV